MTNPHPEKAIGGVPNPRHQDWASGHAIGFSEGLRKGIATANELINLALKTLNHGWPPNHLTIAALEAATEGDPVTLNVEGPDAELEVV